MKKLLQLSAIIIAVVGLWVGAMAPAYAQSNGLGITPTKKYSIQPGAKVSDTLFISNLSQSQGLRVAIRAVDFRAQDETGTPALELSKNAPQTTWSLKPFISLPSTISIAAGKSANVPFTISIPKGQGAGSYYSAVEYEAVNSANQKEVNVAASSASLIFVTVPGQTKENLNLLQFGAFTPSADDQTGNFGSVYFSQPKVLAYRLQNTGNVAEQPSGSILIKNIFGNKTRIIRDANSKDELALRGQTRRFESNIVDVNKTEKAGNGVPTVLVTAGNPKLAPGRYTAELDVFYGQNGNNSQEVKATATFWYLPVWFLAIVLAVIAAIVLFVTWLRRKVAIRHHPAKRRR